MDLEDRYLCGWISYRMRNVPRRGSIHDGQTIVHQSPWESKVIGIVYRVPFLGLVCIQGPMDGPCL